MNNNKSEIRVFSKGYFALVAFFLFVFIVFLGSFIYLYFIIKRPIGIHTLVSIIFIAIFGGLALFTYSMFGSKVYICGEKIVAKKWYGKKTTFCVKDIDEVIFEKSQGEIAIADDLEVNEEGFLLAIRQPMAGDINWNEFISLGFTHHMEILSKTKNIEERIFYIHECATRAWDKYTLREYIKSGLYQQRDNLPNNFSNTLTDRQFAIKATKAFKDNYLLDFINTENLGEAFDDIDERIIENEIVNNIKEFIIRFGTDFIFIGNQYRIEVEGEELYIDLLFFNRELNCLVAVELKAGKFKPAYLGQLNTYLTILDDKVRKQHENPSVGLILCKDMNKAFVDYVIRDYDKPLGVATYKTYKDMPDIMKKALPDIEELKKLLTDSTE